MTADSCLVRVEDLRVWFGSRQSPLHAVDGVSFAIPRGRTVALVGESGCGKTVTALSLARLVPRSAMVRCEGRILFDGADVMEMDRHRLRQLRGRQIAFVFQEPGTALNPVRRVGGQIAEAVRLHHDAAHPRDEAVALMRRVGLGDAAARARAYPHELSGGMQQRIMIAMALACHPQLLVADEPTTALDVTIQAQILDLLLSLQKQLHMAVLLITHNLGLVADTADIVHVMYAGRIVESGPAEAVLAHPAHPYTRGLLDAVPRLEPRESTLRGIEGNVPHPARLPEGCKFAPRCARVTPLCREQEPGLERIGPAGKACENDAVDASARRVRCFRFEG